MDHCQLNSNYNVGNEIICNTGASKLFKKYYYIFKLFE